MNTLIFISAGIFIGFTLLMIIIYGVTKDISHIFAVLPKKIRWVFRVWFLAFILPIAFEYYDKKIIFAGLCILFGVAMFPKYWIKWKRIFHLIAAEGGISVIMLGIIFQTKMWYIPLIWFVVFLPLVFNLPERFKWLNWYKIKNETYWVEYSAAIFIFLSLIYYN